MASICRCCIGHQNIDHYMIYEVDFVLMFGVAALLGFILELIRRKNIINRLDAILSFAWFATYFVLTSIMFVSKWTEPWPYVLTVVGYGLTGLTIHVVRKKYLSNIINNPKQTNRSL